ncbi:hypothetical protein P59_178 [Bacillus phage P59]|nr:hypothetical protein P59_178 [Bacillus phage P59]
MKQSEMTALQIFEEIEAMRKEVNELGEACDQVINEVGAGSVAYKHLNKVYGEKCEELKTLEQVTYTRVAKPLGGPFFNANH